jgi:segregation and condensation protein B
MTDRLDDNPPHESAPLPAWMTLPGSLAAHNTSDTPAEDEPEGVSPEPADGLRGAASEAADGLPGLSPEPDSADGPRDLAPEPGAPPEPGEASFLGPSAAGSPGAGAAVGGTAERGATRASEQPSSGVPDEPAESGPALGAALEAILLVVDEPVPEVTLAQVLERPTHEVTATLRALSAEYTQAGRGFDLREVAGGWRFYTRADCAALVERFVRDGQQTRLTQAALETLAVVAYRQPVSRARVAAVRGVNSDGVMRTLVARGLVEEAGTDPESQAMLYRTSSYFLERLGLKDIGELPELAPFLPDDVENLEENTK